MCDCGVWGYVPENFDEQKHFGACPTCAGTMKLMVGFKPEEIGLPKSKQVVPGLKGQK